MITYRTPAISDAQQLAELGRTTFCDTFAHLYAAEDLNPFLASAYGIDNVRDDICDPEKLIRVAEADGQLLGYCKLGLSVTLDDVPDGLHALELKQLYLREIAQGTGVAQSLMGWALDQARTRGFGHVVLSVWSGNDKAQHFYKKFGFRHIADTHFMVGNHRDDEYLYGLDLAEARLAIA